MTQNNNSDEHRIHRNTTDGLRLVAAGLRPGAAGRGQGLETVLT